jgi:uncharacterized membrane protein
MVYRVLTELTVLIHFAFLVFVVAGVVLVARYKWLLVPHLIAVAWAIYVEASPGIICPLTPLENRFAILAGEAGYTGSFVEHYLVPIIYPDGLTRQLQWELAGLVAIVNLVGYGATIRRAVMTTTTSAAQATSVGIAARVASIDVIRGAVMVLMAIDHVRVYSGLPAGGPSPGIFFTRWVTHFCAPAFIFLAGTSAFLYGNRRSDLSRFLLTRGLWLVLLELTYFHVAWTFNFQFMQYELAGVIWVIGWCMILMAALVRLSVGMVAAIGLVIVAGHNLLDSYVAQLTPTLTDDAASNCWRILYVGFWAGPVRLGPNGPNLMVLYSLVPWIGVMAAGYGFGPILIREPSRRDRACLAIGLSATALFLVLRGFNLYGDPNPWARTLFSFLGTTKYPASLDFLLMTLGPTIALIPILERARGPLARALTVFGRVPFFYYALHIPLIHLLALVVSKARLGYVSPWLFENHPMGNSPPPEGYTWSLGLLYLVWAVAIAILYVACRWFASVKARRRDWWLGYV